MNIILLGSTGSIGTQTLEVVREDPDNFSVSVMTCGSNLELFISQMRKFKPKTVVVAEEKDVQTLNSQFPDTEILWGREGLKEAAGKPADMVVNGLVGMRGLEPTLAALKKGTTVALANKETLVTGGEMVMSLASETGAEILPVDSEHSAIFQCLQGESKNKISRILLTASGGPFRGYSSEAVAHVKLEDALKHPRWRMGKKITIDSATLVNKALEVIEAKWLFGVKPEQIEVLIHPQSIVHSMVELQDGAIMAQMGMPDMRVPISYALNYPNRMANDYPKMNFFTDGASMIFEKPDVANFRALPLGYEALRMGGSAPVVLNGANEALVQLFLDKKIKFIDITIGLEKVLGHHKLRNNLSLEEIIEIDKEARELVYEMYGGNR